MMLLKEELQTRRLRNWGQAPATRAAHPAAATELINRVGLATLFPASPEIPNLFYAYTGDPSAKASSKWDSPAGHVYGWRWELGRPAVAFYTAIVRKRPTWVSWSLLPAILRLCGDLRTPDELYDLGHISGNAYKVAQALERSGPVLSTGELRRLAGFPTGKEQRAAYLKAVEELDTRLLLAKVFSADDLEMRHALVASRYPEQVEVAERMIHEEAFRRFLLTYLPQAVYTIPTVFAKHLRLPEGDVRGALEHLRQEGLVTAMTLPCETEDCYVWKDTP
jgi:hypothetical protein